MEEIPLQALHRWEVLSVMATGKLGRRDSPVTSRTAAVALSRLSERMFHDMLHVYEKLIDAGASNLMQGYASCIITVDFLHSAGLVTDSAYNNVNILSDMLGGVGVFSGIVGGLFGNNALAPVLKTKLDSNDKDKDKEPDSMASTAASTLALAGQIAAAVA